jgi:hypothetical protein
VLQYIKVLCHLYQSLAQSGDCSGQRVQHESTTLPFIRVSVMKAKILQQASTKKWGCATKSRSVKETTSSVLLAAVLHPRDLGRTLHRKRSPATQYSNISDSIGRVDTLIIIIKHALTE